MILVNVETWNNKYYSNRGENIMNKRPEIEERNDLLHEFLNLGEMMLGVGAEIKRVEDTLIRMGKAYGADKMNVFVITSSIVITMHFPDGQELTQTRRIMDESGTNFTKLEALNELSRSCCENPLSTEELKKQLEQLNKKPSQALFCIGSVLGAGSFAIFFGGTLLDGMCAAMFALFICLLQNKLKHDFQFTMFIPYRNRDMFIDKSVSTITFRQNHDRRYYASDSGNCYDKLCERYTGW